MERSLRKEAAAAKPVPEFVPRKLSELSLGGSIDNSRMMGGMMQSPQQQQTNGAFNSHNSYNISSSISSQSNPQHQSKPRSHKSSSFQPPANFGSSHLSPASNGPSSFDGNVTDSKPMIDKHSYTRNLPLHFLLVA